jgi:hypothetical protein
MCLSLLLGFLLLMNVFSATARLRHSTGELCDALIHANTPHVQRLLGRMVILAEEVTILWVGVHLLEDAVSCFICLGRHWLIVRGM